jgi:DNA-binding response OmpR family regulator
MNRILIVEDEPRIVAFLEKGLKANGYAPSVATTVNEALHSMNHQPFDLILLDLNLPDEGAAGGLKLLHHLRSQGEILPVIILSARSDLLDKVNGLDSGANDYITKPYRFEELLARIRVQLRQYQAQLSSTTESMTLAIGELQLNLRNRKVFLSGVEVEFSSREFSLLEVLCRYPGQVLSRDQLLNQVWGYDYEPGSNIVDVHIRNLRQKIGSHWIQTIRGIGYRLNLKDCKDG